MLCAAPTPSLAWRTAVEGTGQAADDFWNTIAFHPSGDPIVAGVSILPGSDYDCVYTVARLSRATGEIVWRNDRQDCGSDETVSSAAGERLLIDPSGDVILGRRSIDPDRAFYVVKFSGDTGDQLWFDRVGSFPKNGPSDHTTALDADGNVLVGAGIGVGCDTSLVVAKLDGTTGTELWRKSLSGTFSPGDQCDDEALNRATGVVADAAGDVLATGVLYDAPAPTKRHPFPIPSAHGIAMKLAGTDGSEMWRVASEGSQRFGDPRTVVGVDEHGNLVQLGNGFTVLERSGTTGELLWRYQWPGATNPYDDAQQLVVADDGAVAVAGVHYPDAATNLPGRTTIGVVRLEGAMGAEAWRREIDPGATLSSVPRGIAMDASHGVLVAGSIENASRQFDFLLAKLRASDGAEAWRFAVDGTADGELPSDQYSTAFHYDDAAGVAVDGDVACVVGSLLDGTTGQDAVALLATGAGAQTWRSVGSSHEPAQQSAHAVAVFPNDDVVAAGDVEVESGQSRFAVRRFGSASGDVAWSADLGQGSATAVATDVAGDVIAGGDFGATGNVAVFKLAGTTGEEHWRFLRRNLRATGGRPLPLGAAGNGDVFVAAWRPKPKRPSDTFVFRLSGADGSRIWRRKLARQQVFAMATDANDDVVILASDPGSNSSVIKLAGATGRKKWNVKTTFYVSANLAVASSGDVILAGPFEPLENFVIAGVADLTAQTGQIRWLHVNLSAVDGLRAAVTPSGDVLTTANSLVSTPAQDHSYLSVEVARLDGATGTPHWTTKLEDPGFDDCGAGALASDRQGNAVIGGCMNSGYNTRVDFAVTVLSFADGALLWQRDIDGSVPFLIEQADTRPVQALAVDSQDRVVAAGATTDNPAHQFDFTVVQWSAP